MRVLDAYEGRYRELRNAADFGEYVTAGGKVADEETLTEPLFASIIEDVLGFGKGDYFPQLGKSGLKPDFTPIDLVTHRFVLDAKGSSESLSAHVAQIRRYVEQRGLRHGVLFNGKHLRVYPAGSSSYDRAMSFDLVPLWRAARGEQLPAGKARREAPSVLSFRRGGDETGRVTGEPERLGLLAEIISTRAIDDVGSLLLPKDLDAFSELARDRAKTVSQLLAEGREQVECVERLVCALYGLSDELTQAVVEHAIARATR